MCCHEECIVTFSKSFRHFSAKLRNTVCETGFMMSLSISQPCPDRSDATLNLNKAACRAILQGGDDMRLNIL